MKTLHRLLLREWEETNNNDEQKNVVKVDRFVDEHDKEYYKFEGKVETNMVNQITNKIVDGVVEGVANIAPSIGAAAAGGTVGSAIIKSTVGLPPISVFRCWCFCRYCNF